MPMPRNSVTQSGTEPDSESLSVDLTGDVLTDGA